MSSKLLLCSQLAPEELSVHARMQDSAGQSASNWTVSQTWTTAAMYSSRLLETVASNSDGSSSSCHAFPDVME